MELDEETLAELGYGEPYEVTLGEALFVSVNKYKNQAETRALFKGKSLLSRPRKQKIRKATTSDRMKARLDLIAMSAKVYHRSRQPWVTKHRTGGKV